jgi:hypothetical protein
MKSIWNGFLMTIVGTVISAINVICLYVWIFEIPTYTGYASIGLLLLTLLCLSINIFFMWSIGEALHIIEEVRKNEQEKKS